MFQKMLHDGRFHELLLKCDETLAAEARQGGCRSCDGRLHTANYPRKPRGGPEGLSRRYALRFGLCCAKEGCRKRLTPPSVRFLGRRVYVAAVVVLVSAVQHGVTPERAKRLREFVGASTRTIGRWREWWLSTFRRSPFWREKRARLARPVDEERLPRSLLDRFPGRGRKRLVSLLEFLSPI